MVDINWVSGVAAGAICLGAGILGVMKSRDSRPAKMFMFGMVALCIAMSIGGIYKLVPQDASAFGNALFKLNLTAMLVALAFIFNLALIFPAERSMTLRPLNTLGIVFILSVGGAGVGLLASLRYGDPSGPTASTIGTLIQQYGTVVSVGMTTFVVLASAPKAARDAKRSSWIFLLGLWIWAITAIVNAIIDNSWAFLILSGGVTVSGLLFALAIASGRMVMAAPRAETMVSSSKSQYNLLRRNVYVVNEPKADFAFKMFSDTLKGRCFDCENDNSFPCESLDCTHCRLPCPCRECAKYASRSQGFIVTRRFPNEIRKAYFLQTTPILWLSTVAGPENLDPAKLTLLTDYLVNFMEKSQNGVVLVDGLEYLMTSNDFPRLLKAVDRWTEVAMTSNVRLIMSVDGRAFEPKELAMLESSRNVVRPNAKEHWKVIPERI